jgi:hypothetical protein
VCGPFYMYHSPLVQVTEYYKGAFLKHYKAAFLKLFPLEEALK